jgi:prepilin-type N-terminal cleavage/methylation domain-containing protein
VRVGFTLIELLVVMAIITVLISIALPVFSHARERARQAACMGNLHHLAMAVRMYRMDMGAYPGPYDPASGTGGLNDLYPAYVSSRKVFICPDDLVDSGDAYVDQKVLIYQTSAPPEVPATYAELLTAASSIYADLDPEYWLNLWRYSKVNPRGNDPRDPAFFDEHYSSYNSMYNWLGYAGRDRGYSLLDLGEQYLHKGDNLAFWYAWHKWDPENDLGVWSSNEIYALVNSQLQYHLAQQTYWSDYDPYDLTQQQQRLLDSLRRPLWDPGNPDQSAYDYMPYGIPSPVFPGLINRNAPDSTIITRCTHHRFTRPRLEDQQDIVVRLDGSAVLLVGFNYDWATQPERTQ